MDASDRHVVDANDVLLDAHLLRRHRADALEQRDALGQVAALRSQQGRGGTDATAAAGDE